MPCEICEAAPAQADSPYCADCQLNTFGPRAEPTPAEVGRGYLSPDGPGTPCL